MRGVLFDVIPEKDVVLVILDDRIAELHGCARKVADELEAGTIDFGNVVIINEIQSA